MTASRKPQPVTDAPTVAVEIYNRWAGQPGECQHGYPQGSVMYRLLFDQRMSKVWSKLRLAMKQEKIEAGNEEHSLYRFACHIRQAVAHSRLRQTPQSAIKKEFEAVANNARKLIRSMESVGFGEDDKLDAVTEIYRLAKARALAASSSNAFDREVSEARAGTDSERFLIAEQAINEREQDPRFWSRSVQRTPEGGSGTTLRFIRALTDTCLPNTFQKILSEGVIVELASVALDVALDWEGTIDQIKDSRRRTRTSTKTRE